MKNSSNKFLMAGLAAAACLTSSVALAAPVDLSSWLADGNGNWTTAADNNSVFQSLNSAPTVFHNNINSQGVSIAGTITVETTSDDDFVGFVLGYSQGDIDGNDDTDYILVDWKQNTQSGWDAGMSISRVTGPIQAGGTDTGADAWNHDGNVEFLGRANTLGNTGWQDNTEYSFQIDFTSTFIRVLFNNTVEFELTGNFSNGAFGFYNFSQPSVRYAGLTETPVPVPPALLLMASAIVALGRFGRRNPASN